MDCSDKTFLQGETGQSFTPSTNGDYAVIVTENGCSDTSSCYAITGIGIKENDFEKNISLHPNPVKKDLTIRFSNACELVEIEVISITGQVVYKESYQDREEVTFAIDGTPGLYFVRVRNENSEQELFKVMKE